MFKNIVKNEMVTSYVMIKPYSEDNQENKWAQEIVLEELKKRFKENNLCVYNINKNETVNIDDAVELGEEVQYNPLRIAKHYQEHVGRPYYVKLEKCLLKNKAYGILVQANKWEDDVINIVRNMAGSSIKVNNETGKVVLPAPGTIRYNMFLTLYQLKNGVKKEDVVIPENLDDCKKVFDKARNCVDVFKNDVKICEMNLTENLIHTSANFEEAKNEISVFGSLCADKALAKMKEENRKIKSEKRQKIKELEAENKEQNKSRGIK